MFLVPEISIMHSLPPMIAFPVFLGLEVFPWLACPSGAGDHCAGAGSNSIKGNEQ